MQRYFQILSLLVILSVTSSCKKDYLDPDIKGCPELPEAQGLGYDFEREAFSPQAPCFNPVDPTEFVYKKANNGLGGSNLYVFNLQTGEDRLVMTDVTGIPDWGSDDWIVSSKGDGYTWIVKSNGDSLRRQNHHTPHLFPIWNPEGDRYVAINRGNGPALYIINRETGIVDSIPEEKQIYPMAWPVEDRIYGTINLPTHVDLEKFAGAIGYFELSSRELVVLHNLISPNGSGRGLTMSAHGEAGVLIWTSGEGLFRTNMYTGETMLLKDDCESRYHVRTTIAPDFQSIVADWIVLEDIGDNTLKSTVRLVKMDPDGSNASILPVPLN